MRSSDGEVELSEWWTQYNRQILDGSKRLKQQREDITGKGNFGFLQ